MAEFKGTTEDLKIRISNEIGISIGSDNESICTVWNHEKKEANANLIIDAFKVRQQINCELSELLEQNKEMFEMLSVILEGKCDIPEWKKEKAKQILTKITDNE